MASTFQPVAFPAVEERRRFTVAEVGHLVAAGVIHEDDPFELIEGDLLPMVPQGPVHASIDMELHERLANAYQGRAFSVRDQLPLVVGEHSMPEPDLALVRGRPRDYRHRHPRADEALLVIEIAHTSQDRDRAKAALYARGGTPCYWLLDLDARRLEVYANPDAPNGRYLHAVVLDDRADVELPELETKWKVTELLP